MDDVEKAWMRDLKTGGKHREFVFHYWETKLKDALAAEGGWPLYQRLFSMVEQAAPDTIKGFQARFVKLTNKKEMGAELMGLVTNALEQTMPSQTQIIAEMMDEVERLLTDEGHDLKSFEDALRRGVPDGSDTFNAVAIGVHALGGDDMIEKYVGRFFFLMPQETQGMNVSELINTVLNAK